MLSTDEPRDAGEAVARAIAGIGGPAGVTLDGRAATATTGEFVSFRYQLAPAGLATRRQLSACGLRPGGAQPVAQIVWSRGRRFAYLYAVAVAKPKREFTAAKRAALAKAMRARKTCPDCLTEGDYVISTRLGACLDCIYGSVDEADVSYDTTEERWEAA